MFTRILFLLLRFQDWEVFMAKLVVWLLKTFLAKKHSAFLREVFSFPESHAMEIAEFFNADPEAVKQALHDIEADFDKLSKVLFSG